MNGLEFREIRKRLKLSKDEFARQLGYRGTRRNNYALMLRYENGSKQIPLTVASLAWLLNEYAEMVAARLSISLADSLPDWPAWPGYETPIGPPIDLDRAERPSAPKERTTP